MADLALAAECHKVLNRVHSHLPCALCQLWVGHWVLPELDPARWAGGIKWKGGSNNKSAVALDLGKTTTMSKICILKALPNLYQWSAFSSGMRMIVFGKLGNWPAGNFDTLGGSISSFKLTVFLFCFCFLKETPSCSMSQWWAPRCSPRSSRIFFSPLCWFILQMSLPPLNKYWLLCTALPPCSQDFTQNLKWHIHPPRSNLYSVTAFPALRIGGGLRVWGCLS